MGNLDPILNNQNINTVPDVRTVAPGPEAYGAGLGRAMEQTGDQVFRAAQRLEQQEEDRGINDAVQKANQWTIDHMYGTDDEQGNHIPGALEKEGEAAKHVTKEFREGYSTMMNEVTTGMPPKLAEKVKTALRRSAWISNERIAGHEATQLRLATQASFLQSAESFTNRAMADAYDDDNYEENHRQAVEAYKKSLGSSAKPGDVAKFEAGLVKQRATVLMDHAATMETDEAKNYFNKANLVISGDKRMDELDRAKLADARVAKQDEWIRNQATALRMAELEEKRALKSRVDSAAAKAIHMATQSALDPNRYPPLEVIDVLNNSPLFNNDELNADPEYKAKVQEQTKFLLTSVKNAAKQPREFPQFSNKDAYRQIHDRLYVHQADAGPTLTLIEDAADADLLSQADYVHFSTEARTKRTDQVNRALAAVIPKFYELDAERGIKPKPGRHFYYPVIPVKQGTPDAAAKLGERHGFWSRGWGTYKEATPAQLKSVVDGVKQFCIEHPEADTETVVKKVLRPHILSVAVKNLDERLPYVLSTIDVPTTKQGTSK